MLLCWILSVGRCLPWYQHHRYMWVWVWCYKSENERGRGHGGGLEKVLADQVNNLRTNNQLNSLQPNRSSPPRPKASAGDAWHTHKHAQTQHVSRAEVPHSTLHRQVLVIEFFTRSIAEFTIDVRALVFCRYDECYAFHQPHDQADKDD